MPFIATSHAPLSGCGRRVRPDDRDRRRRRSLTRWPPNTPPPRSLRAANPIASSDHAPHPASRRNQRSIPATQSAAGRKHTRRTRRTHQRTIGTRCHRRGRRHRRPLHRCTTSKTISWCSPVAHLFGDWCGYRTQLESGGITPSLSFVSDMLGNPVGGMRRGFTEADNLGFSAAVRSQQTLLDRRRLVPRFHLTAFRRQPLRHRHRQHVHHPASLRRTHVQSRRPRLQAAALR